MNIKDQRDEILDKARNSHAYKDEKIKLLMAENAALKTTIEKMKYCENCANYDWNCNGFNDCKKAMRKPIDSNACKNWRLNEE